MPEKYLFRRFLLSLCCLLSPTSDCSACDVRAALTKLVLTNEKKSAKTIFHLLSDCSHLPLGLLSPFLSWLHRNAFSAFLHKPLTTSCLPYSERFITSSAHASQFVCRPQDPYIPGTYVFRAFWNTLALFQTTYHATSRAHGASARKQNSAPLADHRIL